MGGLIRPRQLRSGQKASGEEPTSQYAIFEDRVLARPDPASSPSYGESSRTPLASTRCAIGSRFVQNIPSIALRGVSRWCD